MRSILLISALTAGITLTARADGEWPQFRGPAGEGRSGATSLPLEWSEAKNVVWKTPIHGRAWSSPVVWNDQIWMTTATEDGSGLYGICTDLKTGKIIHDLRLFDVEDPQFAHKFNTYGSPTPVIEEGRVYITFGSPGTACVDTATGKVLWERRDLECNHFRGAGSSPVLFEDLLIMHFDGSDFQYVIALSKMTGETVWKTERSIDFQDLDADGKPQADGDFRKAYSTPLIVEIDGEPVMFSAGSKALYAYDPRTGAEKWRVEERSAHSNTVRPLFMDGLVFFCTGFARGELIAVRPGGEGNVTDTHIAWTVRRSVPNKPSLVGKDGLLFMVDDGGIASCVEAKTGDVVWQERVGGNHSASPLLANGRIYFFNEEGNCAVIEASREFKKVADNKLEAGFMASPAVAGDSLILRTKEALYRIAKGER